MFNYEFLVETSISNTVDLVRFYHCEAIWICVVRYFNSESKNKLKFLCLPEFQFHNTLPLVLLRVNYIQLQLQLHGLTIKTKRILGLKLGQIQVHIIMKCAWRSAIGCIGPTPFKRGSSCYITAMECRNNLMALYIHSNLHRITEFMSPLPLAWYHRINR